VLTSQILPKFVKLHEKYVDDIEKSVGDSRNLAAIITKSFITGIRRVPEALGRLRTSLNLLTQLQSKSHLYYHAAALRILTKEMASCSLNCLMYLKTMAEINHCWIHSTARSCHRSLVSPKNTIGNNQIDKVVY
jgi:hypothetical protein